MSLEGMSRRANVGLLIVGIALIALVVGVFARFISQVRDLETVGQPDNPFVFLLSPAYEATPDRLQELSAMLSAKADFAVEVRSAADAEAVIVTAGVSTVDAWLLPLFDYLFCRQEYPIQAGAQLLRAGGSRTYRGEILVQDDSGFAALQDLSGRRVAFVDPYSTSGFLYPARLLADAGATVTPIFAGSHVAAVASLKEGRVDAAATYERAGDPGLRVLARTADIPNEPVFFRSRLRPELRQRFIDALVGVTASGPGAEIFRGLGDITGFAPIGDADYDAVHQEIEAAGKQLEELVPGGRRIRNENRRPAFDPIP